MTPTNVYFYFSIYTRSPPPTFLPPSPSLSILYSFHDKTFTIASYIYNMNMSCEVLTIFNWTCTICVYERELWARGEKERISFILQFQRNILIMKNSREEKCTAAIMNGEKKDVNWNGKKKWGHCFEKRQRQWWSSMMNIFIIKMMMIQRVMMEKLWKKREESGNAVWKILKM